MATWLRLGRRAINLDLVFEIEDYGDRLRIFYAVASSDTAGVQQPAYADVEGQEAVGLRAWLAQNAARLPGADEAGAAGARAVGAGHGATPAHAAHAAPAAGGQQGDHGPYGVERMRQMHGAGQADAGAERADAEG